MYKFLFVAVLLLCCSLWGLGQSAANKSALETSVCILAVDTMKGRKGGRAEDPKAGLRYAESFRQHGATFFSNRSSQRFSCAWVRDGVIPVGAYVGGSGLEIKLEYVVVGTHFDHLGHRVNYSEIYDKVVCKGANTTFRPTWDVIKLKMNNPFLN